MTNSLCTPCGDALVMAGNGTIGLEIIDDLVEPDAVVVPVGGGGLINGIASAVKVASPGTYHRRRRARDGRAPGGVVRRRCAH